MPLILAIEPDRRQAAQLSVVVRKRVHAELILVDTTERALDAIGNRMPDLVLVPALLSPQDDVALAAALRVIAAAASVQMLTIPVLGAPRPAPSAGGVLSALRRGKARAAEPDGCDPAVFAEQIASYLERAAQEKGNTWIAEPPAEDHAPIARAAVETVPAHEQASPSPSGTLEDALSQEWLESLPPEDLGALWKPGTTSSSNRPPRRRPTRASRSPSRKPCETSSPIRRLPPSRLRRPRSTRSRCLGGPSPPENVPEPDEWLAVEDLMTALQLMPLSAIEVTDDDEWIGPGARRAVPGARSARGRSRCDEGFESGGRQERTGVGDAHRLAAP